MNLNRAVELPVPVSADDHLLGPADAPITIVEYGDYECPTCKQAAPAVKLLCEAFAGQIRFAYRHMPFESVHPYALMAAEAAECAGGQGKFWDMHDILFENQPELQPKHLRGYAERLNLDMERYIADLDAHVYLPRIRDHIASGERSGLRSTPGFFVNGKILDVSFGMEALFDAAKALRQAL